MFRRLEIFSSCWRDTAQKLLEASYSQFTGLAQHFVAFLTVNCGSGMFILDPDFSWIRYTKLKNNSNILTKNF
jgi:hypothetical protein